MNWKHGVEIVCMCGASILIGSLAVIYLIVVWAYRMIRCGGVTFWLASVSIFSIYIHGSYDVDSLVSSLLAGFYDKLQSAS